jgi:hypothetical protein
MKSAAPHRASSASSAGGRSPAPLPGLLDLGEAVVGEYGLPGGTQHKVDKFGITWLVNITPAKS